MVFSFSKHSKNAKNEVFVFWHTLCITYSIKPKLKGGYHEKEGI